ncbi:hypothetical protein RJT34_02442 [Clitoria ternatea]|uniref:Uncharacterized protein n=1 Tax=Clitoria ternatea TaxID=43366 RepID=A0AAN9KHT0_CLITE
MVVALVALRLRRWQNRWREVKDVVRCLYVRASLDLVSHAILATKSLIQLDIRTRETAKIAASNVNANTPTKINKPKILLISK